MAQSIHRSTWSRSEKALIGGSILVVATGIIFIATLRHQEELPRVSIPNPRMPSPNAFDYFTKAGSMVLDGTKIGFAIGSTHAPVSSASSDDHSYTQSEKVLLVQENAPALKTLRQGFAYPYVNPPARSFSALFPYFAKERGLARLLTLEGQTRAGRGDWDGAVNSNLDAVQTGEMIPHGSVMIGGLVGIACEAIGRRPIWRTYDHLSAGQARTAAKRLEEIDSQEVPVADTLQEEKWMGQAGLLEIMRAPNWRPQLCAALFPDGGAKAMEARLMFTSKRHIIADYTAYADKAIASARQPYAIAPKGQPEPNDPVVQMLYPVYNNARIKSVDNQTQNALLMTTLALHAFRQEHGAYPETLTALTPAYLKTIPADPLARSGPVRYRRDGSGYILYSVGPDGRDDGGRAIFDISQAAPTQPGASDQRRFTQSNSKGDVVAGVNIW